MSKKGKRLREFEKKNRAFSVRETKQKEYAPQYNTVEVFDIERRSRSSSEKKEIKKMKKPAVFLCILIALVVVTSITVYLAFIMLQNTERKRLALIFLKTIL